MPKIPDSIPESSAQPHPALSILHRGRLGGSGGASLWRKEVVQGVRCRREKDASDLHAMRELLEGTQRAPWHGSPWDPLTAGLDSPWDGLSPPHWHSFPGGCDPWARHRSCP